MLSSCVVYEVESGLDTEAQYEKLTSGFRHTSQGPEVGTLLTDVGNVERTDRGVEFIGRYDIEEMRPVRENEDPYFAALHKVTVRITDQYFILNSYDSRNKAAKHVGDILELDNDEYSQVEFSAAALLGLIADDASELSQQTWENPTEHADTATVWGELKDSSLRTEFDADGRPSWARFESEEYPGREAGLSTNKDSVVFGSNWEFSEMEDYMFSKVLPNVIS